LGRVTQAGAYGAAGSSQFAYNTLGWKLKTQDADLFTTSYEYDEVGRMVKETTAGNAATYAYEEDAGLLLLKSESLEGRTTTFAYDYFGRASSETQTVGAGQVKNVALLYDSLGRVTDSTDIVRNLAHHFTYPADGGPYEGGSVREISSGRLNRSSHGVPRQLLWTLSPGIGVGPAGRFPAAS
jgi:YD repeat-containing protein